MFGSPSRSHIRDVGELDPRTATSNSGLRMQPSYSPDQLLLDNLLIKLKIGPPMPGPPRLSAQKDATSLCEFLGFSGVCLEIVSRVIVVRRPHLSVSARTRQKRHTHRYAAWARPNKAGTMYPIRTLRIDGRSFGHLLHHIPQCIGV